MFLIFTFRSSIYLALCVAYRAKKYTKSHRSFLADIEKAVQISPLNSITYHYEEVFARVDQILDSNSLLHDIDEAHCHALVKSFHN